MHDIYYINTKGEQLCLTEPPFFLDYEDITDGKYSYTTGDNKRGSKVTSFYSALQESTHRIVVSAETQEELDEVRDNFNLITEYDVLMQSPGTIELDNEWYTKAYIIGSDNSYWHYDMGLWVAELSIIREEPVWWRESIKLFEYVPKIDEYEYLDFDYDFEYDFNVDLSKEATYEMSNPLPCDFEVTISGYVANPEIRIGNCILSVLNTVAIGGTLVINTRDKTIEYTSPTGNKENWFGYRDLDEQYIFTKLEPGQHEVWQSGQFNWTLKVYEERREPTWKI